MARRAGQPGTGGRGPGGTLRTDRGSAAGGGGQLASGGRGPPAGVGTSAPIGRGSRALPELVPQPAAACAAPRTRCYLKLQQLLGLLLCEVPLLRRRHFAAASTLLTRPHRHPPEVTSTATTSGLNGRRQGATAPARAHPALAERAVMLSAARGRPCRIEPEKFQKVKTGR